MQSEIFISKKNSALVTADQFVKFLYKFKKPIVCPVCSSSLWDVQGTMEIDAVDGEPLHTVIESLNYGRFKIEEDSVTSYPGGLPVFRLTCNTCAYMMLFSYKRIRALVEEEAKKTDVSAEGDNNNG
ncbi:hypothetical protein FKK45_10745 [Enterobacter hormaechei]|uniref:hypothetical protein n=1 Tax=Enterobacter hormaechei TaxID=158836 RepID=UPI00190B6DB1|nr:hypothetical protein [Enterobacter hormaechei]MBK2955123.1 hypothetical protein [Enterobacter hormaechei]